LNHWEKENMAKYPFSYILITPARNESMHILKTIESVARQSVIPLKWVIVDDASNDGTGELVKEYLGRQKWIELIRSAGGERRDFASKVFAFNEGYKRVINLSYSVIGCLDADVTFENDYFEFLLEKFEQMPDLGVAGTPFIENGYSSIDDSFEGEKHVAGGIQLFRRKCFEDIGGYVPNSAGGIDWIAVTTARMKGWKTESFREKVFYHHRSLGTAESNLVSSHFKYGQKDYYLGNHPLWEMFRVTYRVFKKPCLTGGTALLAGYLWALVTRMERPVSKELMEFHRREEMEKLRTIIKSLIRFKKFDKFRLNAD
jgi:glycosyltransferase involved in cell wall biosynthesis